MADFSVRSDSVDVEQIMRQIRARIREKRGADYTEAELQQLASVKLEKFLDPRGLRSDLVEQFRRHRIVSEAPPGYVFEEDTLYTSHRTLLVKLRRLLRPVLKLFINPDPITSALHIQAKVNTEFHRRFRQREEMDPLMYELVHNLVVEVTRLGIEVQNLKMRVESLSSRLDFDERRARSREGVVEYRRPAPAREPANAGAPAAASGPPAASAAPGASGQAAPGTEGTSGERRRRRRRRRRRPGHAMADRGAQPGSAAPPAAAPPGAAGNAASPEPRGPEPLDEFGDDDSDADGATDQ
jgi:hypothetical protein